MLFLLSWFWKIKAEFITVVAQRFIVNFAVVKLNAETADEVLKKAVEDQDYEVTAIR